MAKSGQSPLLLHSRSPSTTRTGSQLSLRVKSRHGMLKVTRDEVTMKRPRHRATASTPTLPLPPTPRDLFPAWLLSRKDFQELSSQYSNLGAINVWEVCRRPASERNKLERRAVLAWLADSPFLPEMKEYQLAEVSDRLSSVQFSKGETLIHKGAVADCLYLLYEGSVGVYIDSDRLVDCLYPKNVIGEMGVHSRAIRSATVVALSQVKGLKLTLGDYDLVVYKIKLQHIKDQTKFLMATPYFSEWDKGKVNRLASFLMIKSYHKGQIIYRPGENSYDLFIVRSGSVTVGAEAIIEKTNIWPISPTQSQVAVVSKVYQKTLRECKEGDIFGEGELLEGGERTCTAQCSDESILYIVRKEKVEEVFSEREKVRLKEFYTARPPSAQLRKQLEADHALAFTTRNALLNGISANFLPSTRDLPYKSLRKQHLAQIFISRNLEVQRKQLVSQHKETAVIRRP